MHREVAGVGGAYVLRERSEAYAGDFASESDVLLSDNTIARGKKAESIDT
jgi:hypothetical protein